MSDSIHMEVNPDHSLSFVWLEAGIAVRLSDIDENHRGIVAEFAAECPIGVDVKSGIKITLDNDNSRKNTIKAMHDPALGLDFKLWDELVEYACSETVKLRKDTLSKIANEVPKALTADDILALDTPETPWLVKDLLVDQGTSILASLPKKGKTIFALDIVEAAQTGTEFLGRDIPNVPILYLALEDTKARLKSRLHTIGISGKQVTFILECDLTKGLEPLRKLIETYKPRIVVIDTLLSALRIKDENSPELGIAAQELHDFARETSTSILILHHHGKGKRDDPILDLRGHSSLSGAVDVILGLYPQETAGQFKLKSASRDGESLDLDLAYNASVLKWDIDKGYTEYQKIESDCAMIELLRDLGKVPIEAICQANDHKRQTNDRILKRLIDAGQVTREVLKIGYQNAYVYGLKQ